MQLIATNPHEVVNQFLIPLAHGIVPPDVIVPSSVAQSLGIQPSLTGFVKLSATGGAYTSTVSIRQFLDGVNS